MIAILCLTLLAATSGQVPDRELDAAIQSYQHGKYRESITTLTKEVRERPENSLLRLWLGKSYLKLAKWDDAAREMEKAVQIEPQNGHYRVWLARALGRKAEHSMFLVAINQARRVAKEFETAVRLAPGSTEARFDLLEFYLNAPSIVGGGKDKASAQAAEIARLDKRLGFTARARIFQKEQKWDQAENELVRETEEFPTDSDAFLDLAEYFFQRMNYQRAAEAARESLKLATSAKARLILSASEVRLGRRLTEAETALRTLAAGPMQDEDPSFQDVHYWLGQALVNQGKKADAREEFEKALSYDPDYSPAKAALNLTRREL